MYVTCVVYFIKTAPTDKARKYLEGMDGVKFNEIQVPDSLKKQLEYFDRDVSVLFLSEKVNYSDWFKKPNFFF